MGFEIKGHHSRVEHFGIGGAWSGLMRWKKILARGLPKSWRKKYTSPLECSFKGRGNIYVVQEAKSKHKPIPYTIDLVIFKSFCSYSNVLGFLAKSQQFLKAKWNSPLFPEPSLWPLPHAHPRPHGFCRGVWCCGKQPNLWRRNHFESQALWV